MGFGLFKKIKDAVKKAAAWVKHKAIPAAKPLLNTAVKLAPAISTAIATSQGAPPSSGYAIGSSIQAIGKSLGYG